MSATAAMNHGWFTKHASELANRDLAHTLTNLKKWNARRKLKGAAHAVIMTNRVKSTILAMKKG